MDEKDEMDDAPVEMVVDGILDLHAFSPKDIKYLIPDYLDLCHAAGIFHVRIIHGKGIGNLRRTVHSILAKHPLVVHFAVAGLESGAWGATLVDLRLQAPGNVPEKS
jgi:DNA-nicking Smr family endonuclease